MVDPLRPRATPISRPVAVVMVPLLLFPIASPYQLETVAPEPTLDDSSSAYIVPREAVPLKEGSITTPANWAGDAAPVKVGDNETPVMPPLDPTLVMVQVEATWNMARPAPRLLLFSVVWS